MFHALHRLTMFKILIQHLFYYQWKETDIFLIKLYTFFISKSCIKPKITFTSIREILPVHSFLSFTPEQC